jgi:hypothetical protein
MNHCRHAFDAATKSQFRLTYSLPAENALTIPSLETKSDDFYLNSSFKDLND